MSARETFAEDRYEKMTYRRCGKSGLMLPALSLGFWQVLGEEGNEDLCRQACRYAFDHGITHFDLANNYGPPPGASEQAVGRVLREMPRDELIIATKAGFYCWEGPYGNWGSKKHLIASLDRSLRNLGLDYVDIFYHHRPDPETPIEETLSALELMVRQGKVLYIGLSKYSAGQTAEALAAAKQFGRLPIIAHQMRYNMLQRQVESDLLPLLAEEGIGLLAFNTLAGGILTDRYLDGLPADGRMARQPDAEQWYKRQEAAGTWQKVRRLNDLAKARGQSLAQMALTWVLRDERIGSVVIGASRVEQIAENLQALQADPLSAEELEEIDRILAG